MSTIGIGASLALDGIVIFLRQIGSRGSTPSSIGYLKVVTVTVIQRSAFVTVPFLHLHTEKADKVARKEALSRGRIAGQFGSMPAAFTASPIILTS